MDTYGSEAAFRIHKSDLSIRPIWHQKQERVLAHILVCFLAYVLWKTLASLCQQASLGDEPRRVLEDLSQSQPKITASVPNTSDRLPATRDNPWSVHKL